jgi:hypothetical protein
MIRFALGASALIVAAGLALVAGMSATQAQTTAPKATKAASTKVGAGMKVCKYKFPNGEKRSWTCEKAQPCCAWDQIQYTKCGSTITGCL